LHDLVNPHRKCRQADDFRHHNGANISGGERNFTFTSAEPHAVDVGQQSPRNLHDPSAKKHIGVVRLPHLGGAR
jgi:hypothetical protein